jgi:hypothetical protein
MAGVTSVASPALDREAGWSSCLKAAFVEDRLTKEELDARLGAAASCRGPIKRT